MQKIIIGLTVLFACMTANLRAQEPPTPQEVANIISNYWVNQNFTNMNSYITNLYASYSNYMPAILSASFHDYIFLGKLTDATNKLCRVQQAINSNPSNFSSDFKVTMDELNATMKWEIDLHSRKGRSPEAIQSNASPQAVQNAAGTALLPNINILFIRQPRMHLEEVAAGSVKTYNDRTRG